MNKSKIITTVFTIFSLLSQLSAPVLAQTSGNFSDPNSYLKVSDNKRYLVHRNNNKPFFLIADTAWDLTWAVKPADIPLYLDTRKQQGFTGFLMPVLPLALPGYNPFKVYPSMNEMPFVNGDVSKPNDKFFQHIDYIVSEAKKRDMLVIMFPLFGWYQDKLNPTQGRAYGEYLAGRYKNDTNVIYMLVGDNPPSNNMQMHRQMAAGIRAAYTKAGKPMPMISAHVGGASAKSSYFIKQTDTDADGNLFLDFNTMQTGHCNPISAYRTLMEDYRLSPVKPTFDGEAVYENISKICNFTDSNRATADIVRKSAYQTFLSGGLGHTYGAIDVAVFYDPQSHTGPAGFFGTNTGWKTAIQWEGAKSMRHIYNFFTARNWHLLVPNEINSFVTSPLDSGNNYKAAALASDGTWGAVLLPVGGSVSINMAKFAQPVKASWYNTKTGQYTAIAGSNPNSGSKTFNANSDQETLLVLEKENGTTPTPTPTVTPTPTATPTNTATPTQTVTPTATTTPSSKLGDANGDNKVDILDYQILANNFGKGSTSADFNNDGQTNILDYQILANNFGK